MNRKALERHLRSHGRLLHHHGSGHDIRLDPVNQAKSPVPRHSFIKRGTVRGVCRILGIPSPTGW